MTSYNLFYIMFVKYLRREFICVVYALLFCTQSMTQIQSITIYKHHVVLKTLIRITYRDVHYININHGGNKFCLFSNIYVSQYKRVAINVFIRCNYY